MPAKEKELPLDDSQPWTVDPVFKRLTKAEVAAGKKPELKHWALKHQGRTQKKAHTNAERERLMEFAVFLNKRGMVPREPVQCRADENLPAPPRRTAAQHLSAAAGDDKTAPDNSDACDVQPIHGKA